ncbi:MAG: hypothetical protein JW720_00500 [Sedimentisphaerales bacterium]|nr:hypothetical protein [Sedimentisphaerales bacterium]
MKRYAIICSMLLLYAVCLCTPLNASGDVTPNRTGGSEKLREIFADPPRQYATAPLWVWNDLLTEKQIRETMRDLASQKVMQVFVHPRPGLMTPYLADDWFRLWKVALDEAEKLDMNVWIYDENSYPSGFAGGLVPDAMPESRGKGLHFTEAGKPPKLSDETLAVYRITGDEFENVTEKLKAGEQLPDAQYLVASIRLAPTGGWFGGKYYVDLLHPGVTEKFIEITMGAYKRELGEHFGDRLPGWFTDEPHLTPAGGLHWSDRIPRDFEKRWGYDLLDHLPSLTRNIGDFKRVRHNFQQFLLEEFIACWAKPCYEYCRDNNLEFTGHYWEHGWPGAGHGGDNMAMYAWHQRPAIDTLMNQYSEDMHAQFGNVRSVLELASVANQLGKKRTLCEAYGAGGWDLRFEDMKRIGDWLYVLGVNTLDEHLSYITIRGARKRDHPQSFSYHEPWWPDYHVMARHFTRLSAALSAGQQVNTILLIEPTTTTWLYQTDPTHLNNIGSSFQKLVTDMAKAQIEFDLGCEDIIARHGAVDDTDFVVGQRRYSTVILPPLTENLNSKTTELLEQYTTAGGKVLCCGQPPTFVDGTPSEKPKAVWKNPSWNRIDTAEISMLLPAPPDGFAVKRDPNDKGILFHHRRKLDDGDILFIVNTSITDSSTGMFESRAGSVESWSLETGEMSPYPFARTAAGLIVDFELPPCGSLLLFLSNNPAAPPAKKDRETRSVPQLGPAIVKRLAPNVLTLDYVDITAGGEQLTNVHFYKANQFAFRKNGMERNPWDSAVQFRDELITKTFGPDSGFEAKYKFTIEDEVPDRLYIVIERPDLYTITCNRKKVSAKKDDWWLDKAFGKVNITSAVKLGLNTVTIKASPMTIYHELEPAYVIGDFSLKPSQSGFVVVPPRPLTIGRPEAHLTSPDGTMWLSAGIGYDNGPEDEADDPHPTIVFDLGKPTYLRQIKIWNYNEINLTARGVRELHITGAADINEPFDIPIDSIMLDQALSGSTGPTSEPKFPQRLRVRAAGVRLVKFDIRSNHRGVEFPAKPDSTDNAFVGLSEVQFFTRSAGRRPQRIENVTIARCSSSLGGKFERYPENLINERGLTGIGWDRQGMPFYAEGVSYEQKFNVEKRDARYYVRLPNWYGSVARVEVNGRKTGRIYCRPWQCDVTDAIKSGSNTVEVTIIGTLKNTLGPHHGNHALGSAWPSMFHNGPEPGPPPANGYNTVSYGIFEPIELIAEN